MVSVKIQTQFPVGSGFITQTTKEAYTLIFKCDLITFGTKLELASDVFKQEIQKVLNKY